MTDFGAPGARAAAADLGPALRSARLQFAALGMLAGSWGAHIPSVKHAHGLSEAGLALVLLAVALGCVAALTLAGRCVARLGTRGAAVLAAFAMTVTLASVLLVPAGASLLATAFVLGAGMALFDVCINTEGAALERLGGRPVMSRLHALWSVGAMAGALAAAALFGFDVAPRWQLAGLGLGVGTGTLMLAAAPGMRAAPASVAAPMRWAWPSRPLLLIGGLIFAGMLAEGAMYDWSVLYLVQELGLPPARAALGYAAFCVAMAVVRFGGDALRERHAEPALLRAGGLLAALAMAGVLLAGSPALAWPGFALVGAGLALVAPILYGAAARLPGASPAASIASATSIGYLGLMLGPPLVGAIAQAVSLSAALAVVVVAALTLAAAPWALRAGPPSGR